MKRKCPKCKHLIDWNKEIQSWVKEYGDDWVEWAMFTIYCSKCENYVGSVCLEEKVYKTKLVKAKGLKQKVKVPVI